MKSILHTPVCPVCRYDWQVLANDLERVAHLILHANLTANLDMSLNVWYKKYVDEEK